MTSPESNGRRVTILDVARGAGVSVSTASRAVAGNGYVSKDARIKVLAEVQRLGYVRNHAAKSLRTRRTMTLGLLVADIENPAGASMVKYVEAVSKAAGYRVVLCNSNEDPEIEAEHLTALAEYQVDGLIATVTPANALLLTQLQRGGMVIVQIHRRVQGLGADAVLLDNALGAELTVRHFREAGHRKIAIFTGPRDVQTAQERFLGYERVLRADGIDLDDTLIHFGSFHCGVSADEIKALLSSSQRPTAIFAANNLLAEEVWFAVRDMGLRVPDDISLIGFDDVPWMSMVTPPLTTVRQPMERMVEMAIELLLRRLDGHDRDSPPHTVIYSPELMVRGTVGPVPHTT